MVNYLPVVYGLDGIMLILMSVVCFSFHRLSVLITTSPGVMRDIRKKFLLFLAYTFAVIGIAISSSYKLFLFYTNF